MQFLPCRRQISLAIALLLGQLLTSNSLRAQGGPDALVAVSQQKSQSLVRFYDLTGSPSVEFSIPTDGSDTFLAGKWGGGVRLAIVGRSGSSKTVKFYDSKGTLTNQLSLGNSINSLFALNVDNSLGDELVVIEHESSRAVMRVYYNPGSSAGSSVSVNLPSQAYYYSPAMAGINAIGIFTYSPKVSSSSARTARAKRLAGKKKGGKKKKKPNKPTGSNGGRVQLINFEGGVVASFDMRNSLDGQIYPVSLDGTAGFALREAETFKIFNSQGAPVGDRPISYNAVIAVGAYSGNGNFNELLVSTGTSVNILNMSTNISSTIVLKGFPDQEALLQAEIDRLKDELIAAVRGGKSFTEILALQEKIKELEAQKKEFGGGGAIAPSLVRLFIGGAGSVEGVCDVVFENPNDGYGGFLVKNSDKNGAIVVLTPGGKNYTDGKLIKFKSYKVIETLSDGGYGNPDSHGMRKHFRGKRPPATYGPFIFQAKLKTSFYDDIGELHCWNIKKPSARVD